MLFDAHCHLDAEVFDRGGEGGADAALDRAAAASVAGVVIAGFDGARRDRTLELARREGVFLAAGLHPWAVSAVGRGGAAAWVEAQLGVLDVFVGAHREVLCAVGEVGLDFAVARDVEVQALQRRALGGALEIAGAHKLPVIVHAVRCDAALEEALGGWRGGGLLHAFSGTPEAARRWASRGWHLSLGPPLTWDSAQGRRAREVARQVARAHPDALLLETDAPDRPVAGAQGVGEPAHVVEVFEGLMRALDVAPHDGSARQGWLDRIEASARACFGGLEGWLRFE